MIREMIAVLACVGTAASATTVTFDGLGHGAVVTNQYAGLGLNIAADNFNKSFDLAITFDTTRTGTADPDLEDPWERGNIASGEILNEILIIAENNRDQNNDGFIDNPDDEAGNPAGKFILSFATPQTSFGFDILDIEGTARENGSVSFFSGASLLRTVGFAEIVTIGSAFYDSSVVFGDESANRIQPFTTANLGTSAFDRVEIRLGGSGGINNVTFIPSPGSGALLVSAALLGARRRR